MIREESLEVELRPGEAPPHRVRLTPIRENGTAGRSRTYTLGTVTGSTAHYTRTR